MKKIIVLLSFLFMGITAVYAETTFGHTWTYDDGSSWSVAGEITSIDLDGTPHGCGTITVIDANGNSISWDYTFSYHVNTNDPNGQKMFDSNPRAVSSIEQYIVLVSHQR